MITQEQKNQIREIYRNYSSLRETFKKILDETERLTSTRNELADALLDTRKKEEDLINKIEQQTGQKLTAYDLMNIINCDE